MELIEREPFTKEQLIEIAQENVDVWQLAMETESLTQKKYAAIRLRVAEIALAALTAPELPPEGTGAKGRSMDASYRRQGAVCGWRACLESILGGLTK